MKQPNYGEQGLVDVPHVTPQSDDRNPQAFNAIITNPPNMSNPPIITAELDIEHGLNTNSHSNLDDIHNANIKPNTNTNTNTNNGESRNNNKDKRTSTSSSSSSSSRRSSKGNGRRKKRERDQPSSSSRKRRKKGGGGGGGSNSHHNGDNNHNHSTSSSSHHNGSGRENKYVSIKQDVEASVKGGSGSGYRMFWMNR